MTALNVLQGHARGWHDSHFAEAPNAAVALKLGEEAGELMKAVNRIEHARDETVRSMPSSRQNLRDEFGDVMICLLVLADRYGLNLLPIVEDRLDEVMNREPGDV